jgi:hypothetical protein
MSDLSNLAQENGKLAISHDVAKLVTSSHENSSPEKLSKTHSHRNPGADARVGEHISRFSREVCEQYAEHLFKSNQGIKNPMGFAKQIIKTGEDDSKIEAFLAGKATLSIDINECPDCLGQGVRPHSSGKGYVKCHHLSLKHADID